MWPLGDDHIIDITKLQLDKAHPKTLEMVQLVVEVGGTEPPALLAGGLLAYCSVALDEDADALQKRWLQMVARHPSAISRSK